MCKLKTFCLGLIFLFICLTNAQASRIGFIVSEVDGDPDQYVLGLKMPNGSISISGNTATYTAAAGGGDLLADGSVPLTANWDVGAYYLTGLRFISDVATGTAPYSCSSTTLNTNLNADLLDGVQGSGYLQTAGDGSSLTGLQFDQFITQTAWRIFYSNGDGDVTEVALGANGTYLKSNGASAAPTFDTPAGSGDVVGPGSATDSVPVLFDGTTGKLVKNSTPTGTGNPVLATSPTLVTPNLGTPSALVVTNASGTASININGTVGATTPSTGAFTTITATGGITSGASADPTITLQDSDDAAGTGKIYSNSSGGVNDVILYIGVEDSTGESTHYIEVDGVSETVDFLKPTVLQNNDIIAGEIADWYAYDVIPVAWMKDGSSAPAALDDATTRSPYAYRDFDSTADEDLNMVWFVPSDLSGSTIQFRVKYLVTNATGPSAEGVAFGLSGVSLGDNDATNGAKGTVVVITDTSTAVQHDILITDWSGDVTITNLLAGEVAELALIRDVSDAADDYAQDVGVFALELRYVKNVTR